jgi:glutamin-(asparagin-)ase
MRPATALAADGPANLRHAVAVAAHPSSAGRGVLVVMNEQVHSARDVTKVHTQRLDAFASPHGALGAVVDGAPRWWRALVRPHTADSAFDIRRIAELPLVGLVMGHGNARPEPYQAWADAGARAIVHAGVGGGSVPLALQPALHALCQRGVTVVRASRTGAGPLVRNASFDDDACGSVTVDDQNPARARLLAALVLAVAPPGVAAAPALQAAFDTY